MTARRALLDDEVVKIAEPAVAPRRAVMPALADMAVSSRSEATAELRGFLKHRWIGLWPILAGAQLRQAALDEWIARGTLDVDHAPGAADPVEQYPVGTEIDDRDRARAAAAAHEQEVLA